MAEDKVVLTPKQCADQFRMYAGANECSSSKHQLKFCADFLDEFCTGKVVTPELADDFKRVIAAALCTSSGLSLDTCKDLAAEIVDGLLK